MFYAFPTVKNWYSVY